MHISFHALLTVTMISTFPLKAMEKNEIGKIKIPSIFSIANTKPAKRAEPAYTIPAQHQEACTALMEAHTNKKNSVCYKPVATIWNSWKTKLATAIEQKDSQACAELLAQNGLAYVGQQDLLFQTLQKGYYPLCHVLLTTRLASAHYEDNSHKTPLYHVLAHGSALPPGELLALCGLLKHHGAAIDKPLKDGRCIFESLASNLDLPIFYFIFPTLRKLGLSPEIPDDHGVTTMHRLARSKNINTKSLTNAVIPYQIYNERRTLLTVLLIHKYHPRSDIGRIPRDVVRAHIIPYICPFGRRLLNRTVTTQLVLLRRLLSAKTKLGRTPKDILDETGIMRLHNSDLLDPQKVEQHRNSFIVATRLLMTTLDAARK
ncbi:MAG: hypothetical protein AB7F19_00315 [Candidatus Babeliales bacterium]